MIRRRGHDHDCHRTASFGRRAGASLQERNRAHCEEPLRGYDIDETAEVLSFSTRWVRSLTKRYNEGGPALLGDQRVNNGTEPTILTPGALGQLKERLKAPQTARNVDPRSASKIDPSIA